MTRKHRKIYKQGKRDGYLEGYAQGVHDGNPFSAFCGSLSKVVNSLADCLADVDPEKLNPVLNQTELKGGREE